MQRQTEIFLMRELYALRKGERVLHTAHQTATSNDASQRLAEMLTMMGYEEVIKEMPKIDYERKCAEDKLAQNKGNIETKPNQSAHDEPGDE